MASGLKLHHAALAVIAFGAASLTSKAEHASEKTFAGSIVIASEPETVWHALTKKVHVDKYSRDPLGKDVVGAETKIYFGSADRKKIVGEVAIFEPPMRLTHTFRFNAREGARTSYVTYWIKQVEGGSKLTISHVGYKANSPEYVDVSTEWPLAMNRLKAYIEK